VYKGKSLGIITEEVTDISCSVFDDPETDLQPNHNVNPGNQTANDHAESPTIFPKGLSAESMRKEATVDPPKSSESDGSEGNSNPDYERRPSQEISKPGIAMTAVLHFRLRPLTQL